MSIYSTKTAHAVFATFFILTGLLFSQNTVMAATTGQVYPTLGTTAAESPWLDNDWVTPTNIYSDDTATANVTSAQYDSPDQTYVLKATGFNFSAIPDGSTINGITARINAFYRSGQGSGSMDLCQLLDISRAKVGTNNCSTPTALTTTTSTIITKGGATDKWGNTLTTAWIKDPDFGIAMGVLATAANADVDIDYVSLEIDYTPPPTTTLGTDTDPSSATIAPGAGATAADAFTLQTNTGTDAITAVVVGLGTNVYTGVGLVEITNDAGSTVYGSVTNPGSDTPSISLTGLTATNVSTIYRIRVTPKIHTSMPAVPGAEYVITAKINSWTGTNTQAGSDTAGATVTIDNLSPSNVTTPSASTAGDTQATIRYTTPAGTDLASAIILRNTVAITGTPTEGVTYNAGDSVGSDTVACVDSTITASTADSCIATGLSNGTTYYFKIFMKDTHGNYSQTGVVSNPTSLTPNGTITLGNGTDPSPASLAPGGAATMADAFTFQASTGTNNVTAVVVGLATGTYVGLSLVEITNDAGTTVYGSTANPLSDTPSVALTTPITTTISPVQYKIRVTPRDHGSMPAVPGATYLVTAKINSWTSSYTSTGSDTAGTTVTIDNASPNGATSMSGSAIDARVTLNWTTSNSADFNTTSGSVIYRWTGASAGSEVPAEGSTASVPGTNGTATVACVISSAASTPLSKIDGTGGSTGCNTTALTNGQAYTYKVFQKDSNGNYDAGVLMGTFTPNAAPALSISQPTSGNTNVVYGSSYNITYTLADPDNVVTAAFYYDTNNDGVGGIAISGCGTKAEGTDITCSFATSVLTLGVPYYIYGVTSDGVNPSVTTISAGTITITDQTAPVITMLGTTPLTIALGSTYTDAGATALDNVDGNLTSSIVVTNLVNTAVVGTYTVTYNVHDAANNNATPVVRTVHVVAGTTLINFITAEPVNSIIAPGASGLVDSFGLATNAATDTVTGATITLAAGTGAKISTVSITNDGDTVTYCSATPSGDTATLTSCGIPVSTTSTQFKIKITTVPHASMPAVPGGEYAVTGTITSFTSTNSQTGSDTASATVTIDNLSPANSTAVSGSAADTQVALNWTNPHDSDFGSTVILRDTSSVTTAPTEGTTYIVGNTIGTATVACVVTSPSATCTDTSVTNGIAYHYKNFSKDTNGNYGAGVIPTGSPFTPALATFTIFATAGAHGSISPSATTTVSRGSSRAYTILPDSGYDVASLTIDGVTTATSTTSYTFTNVQVNHTIDVAFVLATIPTFTIFASTGAHGSISPNATTTVTQGGSQVYNINPDSGYDIATLAVDSLTVAVGTPYTFTNVQANHTIYATFAAVSVPTFTITATAGAYGSISPSGVTTVTQGGLRTYTITPNSGYEISTLMVDGLVVAATNTYVFSNVQANHTIEATFVATPPTGGAALPDTGPVRPTTITFSGKAFPGGKVSIIDKQLNTETTIGQDYVTDAEGSFNISFIGILQALHSFGIKAKDKDGRVSQTKLFFINTISDSLVEKDILLSPTIGLANGQVTRGDSATITGYATPGNTVRLELDGILIKDMLAGSNGAYKFDIPTGVIEFGSHTVRTKQVSPAGKESDFSVSRTMVVSRLLVVQADLNSDGKVDIRDWSIFLSLWGDPKASGRSRIDINNDGKVDITDFSIFVKTLKR